MDDAFRYAQHLAHGCDDVEVRTKLLLAQARNLERTASYDEEDDDDDDDDELDASLVSPVESRRFNEDE